MVLYKMCEWEHNGYDDSDWYAVVYDSEKDELRRVETGTTRFANALHCGPVMETPTEEIMEKAKLANLKLMLPMLKQREHNRVMEPYSDLQVGTKVRISNNTKIMEKETNTCQKCNGTGKWVNPKRAEDQRTCFACSGVGTIVSKNKVKDQKGKQKYIYLNTDMSGEIVDIKVWGTFYHNGYNKPSRDNTRVLVKFNDGNLHWVSCNYIRLDEEIKDDEFLIQRWKQNGGDSNFYFMFKTSSYSLM